MPTPTEKTNSVLSNAQAKGLALAASTLPKIAEVAERAGQSLARASSAAGHAAADKLQTVKPSTAATVASAVAASGMALPLLRLAFRRPVALAIGGFLLVRAGTKIWRNMQAEAPTKAQAKSRGGTSAKRAATAG